MPIRPVASVARPLHRSLLTCAQRPPKATRISLISAPIAFPTPRLSARTMSSSAAATTHLPNPEPSPAGQVPGQGKPNLHLYTWGTPNGYKVSILLEELRAAYPEVAKNKLAYDMIPVDISTNVQKTPEFLKVNPNGRIPALIDDSQNKLDVWESASIELYLQSQYDPDNKFWFSDVKGRSDALSWIFFAHGGVGPMQGQAHHFYRYAPLKIPYGIKRYIEETERLYSVLEAGLEKGNGWLAGGKYSVADINVYPWVRSYAWAGIDISKYPRLGKWIKTIEERPAVQKGLTVPNPPRAGTSEEELEKIAADVANWKDKAEKELDDEKKKLEQEKAQKSS